MPTMINLETVGRRRSPRDSTRPNRLGFTSAVTKIFAFGTFLTSNSACPMDSAKMFLAHAHTSISTAIDTCHTVNRNFDGTLNGLHHMVLASGQEHNEIFTFRDMLKQDDAKDFVAAMIKEARDHESRGHWEMTARSKIPKTVKTIQAIWSFKRKRFPDGTLNKHKSRLCAHGGMQQWGINYWETYAPVVNWTSVRLLMILAKLCDLDT